MIALILLAQATTMISPVSATSTRKFTCLFGRVTGSDAQNKAIIEGSFSLKVSLSSTSSVDLVDPTALLGSPIKGSVRVIDSEDGAVSVVVPYKTGWLATLKIDAEKTGSKSRVAVVMRLHPADGKFDPDWFYYGHCVAGGAVSASGKSL